jgi:hypothetical protein
MAKQSPICDEFFESLRAVKRHIDTEHRITNDKMRHVDVSVMAAFRQNPN